MKRKTLKTNKTMLRICGAVRSLPERVKRAIPNSCFIHGLRQTKFASALRLQAFSYEWYNGHMLSRALAIITLAAFVILSALLQSTTPATIHPVGILSVFVLFYLLALGVLTFFMFGFSKLLGRFAKPMRTERSMSFRQAYYYASVIALAPVLLVGMHSVGRGTILDIILVLAFEVIACFYIAKRQ